MTVFTSDGKSTSTFESREVMINSNSGKVEANAEKSNHKLKTTANVSVARDTSVLVITDAEEIAEDIAGDLCDEDDCSDDDDSTLDDSEAVDCIECIQDVNNSTSFINRTVTDYRVVNDVDGTKSPSHTVTITNVSKSVDG